MNWSTFDDGLNSLHEREQKYLLVLDNDMRPHGLVEQY